MKTKKTIGYYRPCYVYVMKCEDDTYYIGSTVDLRKCYQEHMAGRASKYTRKFFWNPDFQDCPKELQQEMQILCVMFTEEVGGIVIVYFDDNGSITMVSSGEEDDPYFDRIGSGLKLEQVKGEKRQLFERIEAYYQLYC